MAKEQSEAKTIYVQAVRTKSILVALIGVTPLILNRMSEKAKGDLLFPKGKKTESEKRSSMKHVPLDEYRASAYVIPNPSALLGIMASAVKGCMMTAALDLPGAKKAQVGRLVYVAGDYLPVYGIPKLFMSVTRSADMNRTPDIRTRVIVPEWCVIVTVTYVTPLLNETSIMNLLSAGGITAGLGDWRPEKGKGNYGQFRLASSLKAPEVQQIIALGGREAQQEALNNPQCYDDDTERLLAWYNEEVLARGKQNENAQQTASEEEE